MVDFRKELRPASFRGIAFNIMDDGLAAGRRVITHEVPGRDDPIHEDLGQSPRAFEVTAIVIGGGFVGQAAALEAALLKLGAGSLIHPMYGEMQVVVKSFRRQQNYVESIGEVAFSISFERAGKSVALSGIPDTARNLSFKSAALFTQAQQSFMERIQDAGVPDYVLTDGLQRAQQLLGTARTILTQGGVWNIVYPELAGLSGGMAGQIVDLFRGVADLVTPKPSPAIALSSAASMSSSSVTAASLTQALTKVASQKMDSDSIRTNPSSRALKSNAKAITDLFQQTALAAAGQAARYAEYTSKEEAIQVRSYMVDALSNSSFRAQESGRVEDFRATMDMMAAVTEDISERLGRLPSTILVKPPSVLPTLVIANRLYGDDTTRIFARAEDIAARNRVAHPGFVGASPLEVLIND
ncbi:MAG: hypothetical protein FJX23_10375 [Alphaproteobacteria bacterium]|nr:hypothetical protein [Alphaproteobacteria bacterium]